MGGGVPIGVAGDGLEVGSSVEAPVGAETLAIQCPDHEAEERSSPNTDRCLLSSANLSWGDELVPGVAATDVVSAGVIRDHALAGRRGGTGAVSLGEGNSTGHEQEQSQ